MSQRTTIEPPRSHSERPTVPSCLDSPRAKLIWITAETHGPLSVRALGHAIDVPLLTLLPQLRALEDEGLLRWNLDRVTTEGADTGPKQ
jgi:hypothetical protein